MLKFLDFLKKTNLKKDTMKESHLQMFCICLIYSRDSKKFSDRVFANIDRDLRVVLIGFALE